MSPAANFEAKDGRWVQVMAVTEQHWKALCEGLGHPEWLTEPRFADNEARVANRDAVHAALAEAIRGDTADRWEFAVTRRAASASGSARSRRPGRTRCWPSAGW